MSHYHVGFHPANPIFESARDGIFERVVAGAKGTKLPRGGKKQMMQYSVVNDCDEEGLDVLALMPNQISTNNRENARLSALRDALLLKLMAGEIDVLKVELPMQMYGLSG